ncbi:MAG: hypothetical protein FD143_1389 [Ignavibacteria bacterium]|nr:MAG: hypothetical protein FD143_1389 [Ignavibacteria bacterium]KAF0161775.1 MAG: hypothetical protein FD188_580 [Ignavibacteria bacterium]
MRKKLFAILSIIAAVFTLSCSDTNFNPYDTHQEKFVMNCILHPDSSFQIVTLNRSYMVNNFDPFSSTEDTFVKGALVRLWNGNNEVVVLRDTTLTRTSGDPYNKPHRVYYTKNFKPKTATNILLEALLPNGKRLTSSTYMVKQPMNIEPLDSMRFYPKEGLGYAGAVWTTDQRNAVFATKATILYSRQGMYGDKVQRVSIPAYINKVNGSVVKYYPQPTNLNYWQIDSSAINYTLRSISEGDPAKDKYLVYSMIFEVSILDNNLSLYYNATSRGKDLYSVVIDETDYSCINGGFGVFGTYAKYSVVMTFDQLFLYKLGYKSGTY